MTTTAWTDELKKQLAEEYLAKDPTPENTMDIVNELAKEYEKTPNGVRIVLNAMDVYVKKAPAAKAAGSGDKPASTRVSKQASIADLIKAIEAKDLEVDEEIISKLTGKAAVYITSLLT